MESSKPVLTVVYSATALKEPDKIWAHNAKTYASSDHANNYVDFLKTKIKALSNHYEDGRVVETNDKLRYIVMKPSSRGNGHVAVYRISSTAVRIVHVFHTSQNWESKIKPRAR